MGLFSKKKKPEPIQQAGEIYIRLPQVQAPKQRQPKISIPFIKPKKDNNPPVVERQDIIRPFVISSHADLESASKGKFKEKERKNGGVITDGSQKWDKERIRALLVETDPEKLPMLTVTRKSEFNPLVRATTFDEVARMGQSRNLREDSFISLYIHNRDVRAPSAFPEEGDSRKEMMKQLEYMITEEQTSRDMMKW